MPAGVHRGFRGAKQNNDKIGSSCKRDNVWDEHQYGDDQCMININIKDEHQYGDVMTNIDINTNGDQYQYGDGRWWPVSISILILMMTNTNTMMMNALMMTNITFNKMFKEKHLI